MHKWVFGAGAQTAEDLVKLMVLEWFYGEYLPNLRLWLKARKGEESHDAGKLTDDPGKIIGGKEAKPHSRPYMAFLEIQDGEETFGCCGFLVAENFVLTAAHCPGAGMEINVILGAHDIGNMERTQQKMSVSKKIPHPEYDEETFNNDIMLLKVHSLCNVSGWGMTSLTATTDTLREVNLSVVTDDDCKSRYLNYFPISMLCVGVRRYRRSTYQGDSGGPLVCGGVAEGIVSFGVKNSITPPVVFTRISHFLPWIKANMR
nr:mast cell protease 1A-like [Pelodiscus sinensis]|eukprot:XP_025045712.1 mast cell protease 1A-like [Pelodiscus sinensis]